MGRHRRRAFRVALAALAAALLAASCASGPRVYVNPGADMSFYKKVAVLPFTNLSTDGLAAARVTRALVTELIMADAFRIVQPEDFVATLQKVGVNPAGDGSWDLAQVQDAAKQAGINGILRGAVSEYQVVRTEGGDVPVVAFDAELSDANPGDVVWRSSISRRGRGRIPVIGGGSRSLGRLTQDACEEMVARLRKVAL